MAIEQLFDLPLHHLQYGISEFGASNIVFAMLVTAALGVLMDYAWILYLGSKMVSIDCKHSEWQHSKLTATWAATLAYRRQHLSTSR
jgi:hypothetical protein